MNRSLDDLIASARRRTCRTTTRGGYCGQPAVSAIGGIPVCAECKEAAAPVLDYLRDVLGDES